MLKNPEPLGERAILPCPRAKEGECRYRKPFGCDDTVRDIALGTGGSCVLEIGLYELLWKDLFRILDYRDAEAPGSEVARAVELLVEATIYARRALSHELRRYVGEVSAPGRGNPLRFVTSGFKAQHRRENELAIARMRELNLDVERILKECGGHAWTWWREASKVWWYRSAYTKPKVVPKVEPPDPRVARRAEWARRQAERAKQGIPEFCSPPEAR